MFEIRGKMLENLLEDVRTRADSALSEVCTDEAQRMESRAKREAPWTDRTGNARRTLEGFCGGEEHMRYVGVCGNMEYSPNLELLHEMRYAILYPTVQEETSEFLARLSKIVIAVDLSKHKGD